MFLCSQSVLEEVRSVAGLLKAVLVELGQAELLLQNEEGSMLNSFVVD